MMVLGYASVPFDGSMGCEQNNSAGKIYPGYDQTIGSNIHLNAGPMDWQTGNASNIISTCEGCDQSPVRA